MNKVVCISGLAGSGKSLVTDYLVNHKGFQMLRFGQITLDEVKRRGVNPSEAVEREIREEIRKKHGMAAYAILNLPKLDALSQEGNVVADGLYSLEEYKVLKEHFGPQMIVLAVFAPPELRYARLASRNSNPDDVDLRYRHFTEDEAKSRDFAELEHLNKGGPIALADYTLINSTTPADLYAQIDAIIK